MEHQKLREADNKRMLKVHATHSDNYEKFEKEELKKKRLNTEEYKTSASKKNSSFVLNKENLNKLDELNLSSTKNREDVSFLEFDLTNIEDVND